MVFFELKSLSGIVRQWSLEKFAVLTLKPWSHVRILIYPIKTVLNSEIPDSARFLFAVEFLYWL